MSSPIVGPISPENNPPINPQYFQPSQFIISAISFGSQTTITTSVNHNYVVGQIVRILIPFFYGANQLNEQEGIVTSIPAANQVVVNINSMNVDPFNTSPVNTANSPQIVAIGDINSGQINASGRVQNSTFIPGSFENISPL